MSEKYHIVIYSRGFGKTAKMLVEYPELLEAMKAVPPDKPLKGSPLNLLPIARIAETKNDLHWVIGEIAKRSDGRQPLSIKFFLQYRRMLEKKLEAEEALFAISEAEKRCCGSCKNYQEHPDFKFRKDLKRKMECRGHHPCVWA